MEADQVNIIREAGKEPVDIQLKVTLENGVTLYVCRSGGAEGSDGKTYFPVLREVRETFRGHRDKMARIVGWSNELGHEKVISLEG